MFPNGWRQFIIIPMGIKFRCPACDKKLHVKAFLAGKRGVCPKCGAKIGIPLSSEDASASAESTPEPHASVAPAAEGASRPPAESPGGSAEATRRTAVPPTDLLAEAPVHATGRDPIAEAPSAVWYVRPPSGGQFGPADAAIMRRWIEEGRIGADALVWREGWSEWSLSRSVFASLEEPASAATEVPAAVSPAPGSNSHAVVVVAEQRSTPIRRTTAPRTRGLTRSVAIVVALGIVCVALGVALFLVLRRTG